MIRAWVSKSNRVAFLCSLLSAVWISAGHRMPARRTRSCVWQAAETRPEVAFLSWDTEGGDRAATNLLRTGQAVTPRVRVSGQWLSAPDLPIRMPSIPLRETSAFSITFGKDAKLSWS